MGLRGVSESLTMLSVEAVVQGQRPEARGWRAQDSPRSRLGARARFVARFSFSSALFVSFLFSSV